MQSREPVLNLIIAYKLVRAGVAFLVGVTALLLVVTELDAALHEGAVRLGTAAAGLSALLQWATEPKRFITLGALLTLDGLVTFVEGWALLRGWWWGVWLVVVASALLLPFEVAAIAARVSAPRVVVLVINLAIVGWLIRARMMRAS